MVGLSIYSMFSRKWFKRVPHAQWGQLDGLNTTDLDAVFSYYDAQTDDARLTRSVLASAKALGAQVCLSTALESASLVEQGCRVTFKRLDPHSTGSKEISARVLINAAGPWINDVLERIDTKLEKKPTKLVQGTHIIVPGEVSHPYYLESPRDNRAVFVTLWKNQILVGTTENDYEGDPANVSPLDSEINYLLEIYNHYFKRYLKPADIINAFAGLRVLPGGSGEIFKKSRDTHFGKDRAECPRVITIYGGKLTSYRATSEKLVDMLSKFLPKSKRLADTRKLALPIVD